ncbi:hypothetical protein CDD80_6798 [Ophiocordyceps camponoti-rufipedis]|uniref:RRM domain-containing protein n=1 Tax=Ophiocordyceps camponoti-rufipedis TaxID=2004952 RepID=A0A2C5XEB9_9HYPO|nr:hypothetical protein CDD80_6798 [Ophiocordyceps camponoti-rufipedis]
MPRNEGPDNTIMRDVPPGDETGIYYLPISGLPFGTIWQLLKDWLRHAGCDVDHIEVFQKSTSGWVRLIGKHNFERALRHLRTIPYNNRLLICHDRNRSESVKIMELIDDPPPRPRLGTGSMASRGRNRFRARVNEQAVGDRHQDQGRPRPAAGLPSAPAPAPAPAPGYPPPMPAADAAASPPLTWSYKGSPEIPGLYDEHRGQYGIMAEPFAAPKPWPMPYAPAYAPVYRPPPPPPPEPAGIPSRDQQQAHRPGYHLLRHNPSGLRPSTNPSDALPRALLHEPDGGRRVKMEPLRRDTSSADVEAWVRNLMGEWASALSRVDVVTGAGNSRFRPYGHVTFLSSAAARRAVELLHLKMFRGRSITVRLLPDDDPDRTTTTTEYPLPSRPPPQPSSSADALPAKRVPSPRQSPRQEPPPPVPVQEPRNATPVIAHGSFYRPKS